MLTSHCKPIGVYLVDAGLLSLGQVEVILADQRATGLKFGEIAATRGWIKQQTIEYLMTKVILPERYRQTYPDTPSRTTLVPPSRQATIVLPGRQQGGASSPPRSPGVSNPKLPDPQGIKPSRSPSRERTPAALPQDDVDWVG